MLPGCGVPWILTDGSHRNPQHQEAATSGLIPEGGQLWPSLIPRRSQFLRSETQGNKCSHKVAPEGMSVFGLRLYLGGGKITGFTTFG